MLVWEPRNGQCIVVLAGHRGWVRCLCTYLDPHHGAAYGGFPRIASGSFDKTVKIWDPLVGGAPIYTIDLPAMATGLLVCLRQASLFMSGDGRPPGRRDDAADTDHVQGGGHRPAEARPTASAQEHDEDARRTHGHGVWHGDVPRPRQAAIGHGVARQPRQGLGFFEWERTT